MKTLRHFLLIFIIWAVTSCKPEALFLLREYYGGNKVLTLNSDNSYIYYTRSEAYVRTFSHGNWRQEGKSLFLNDDVSKVDELPIVAKEFEPNSDQLTIVVSIRSQKQVDWEQSVTDVVNVEMVANGIVYPIRNQISMIKFSEHFDSAYFRTYPKPNSLNICEQLNDTLRTKAFRFIGGERERNGMLVDLDINPLYFARVRIQNDTLRIVNSRKLKWDKISFERTR